MNTNHALRYALPCLTALAAAMGQAYAEDGNTTVSGVITPKAGYFNASGNQPTWVQSNGGQKSWSGDRDNGSYGDFDLELNIGNVLSIEREGFGADNHRGKLNGGNEAFGIKGYYSHFRTNSNGLDYPNRPGTANNPVDPNYLVNNSGYIRQFNDDSPAGADFHVERTRYGLMAKLKPGLLGKDTSLSLGFDGYTRDGSKFASWVAGGSDGFTIPTGRWRGYEKKIDEKMGRLSLNFTTSPGGLFQMAYDGSIEKFDDEARTALMGDFGTVNASANKSLHFAPDTTLISHAIRLSKHYGNTSVALGYGQSQLKQDSQAIRQEISGFRGKINNENAFLTATHRFSPGLSAEGHIKYRNRDNDASLGNTTLLNRTNVENWGVRIARLESLDYGLAASLSGLPAKSSLTVGWKHEDSDRDLEWQQGTQVGITPSLSLYSEETVSDEVYLKWVARPLPGMTLRITPSYVWADKTALISVAEKSFNLKTKLSYAVSTTALVNAYYNYKDKQNDDLQFLSTNKPVISYPGPNFSQKADDTFHAAGISLNLTPSEWLSLGASLDWAQNDFDSYFLDTNVRRFENANVVFAMRGDSNYKVDTWSLTLNGDYQPTDALKLSASYSWSLSDGAARTSGLTTAGEALKDKIDNTLHSLAFGVAYELQPNVTLRGMYAYDRYDDKVYDNLDGRLHSLMMGVSLGF
jgi:hypothetical protein